MRLTILLIMVLGLIACGKPEKGDKGDSGESIVGATGATGADGQDANPVTVVKLCQGVTTYPDTFVEVAFCISGHLYATYSTHGGFSTEIVPGTYLSNAVGSSCTFVVQPNCVVVN